MPASHDHLPASPWRLELLAPTALEDRWGELRDGARSPFQTPAWLKAFAAREAHLVWAERDGHHIVLPFERRRHRWGTALEWLGQDWTDYNAPLLSPGIELSRNEADALMGRALDMVARTAPFDAAVLRKEPEWLWDGAARANPFGRRSGLESDGGHSLAVPADATELKALAGNAKSRSKMRRKWQKLAARGEIELALDLPTDRARPALDAMLDWKSRQLDETGANNPFRGTGGRDVLGAALMVDGASGEPRGRMAALFLNGAPVAAIYLLIDRGNWLLYQASYAPDGPVEHSPGRLLLDAVVKAAIEEGAERFDFGGGDEAYKLPLSERRDRLGYTLVGRSPRGRLALPLLAAHLKARAWAKATPERMETMLRLKRALPR